MLASQPSFFHRPDAIRRQEKMTVTDRLTRIRSRDDPISGTRHPLLNHDYTPATTYNIMAAILG